MSMALEWVSRRRPLPSRAAVKISMLPDERAGEGEAAAVGGEGGGDVERAGGDDAALPAGREVDVVDRGRAVEEGGVGEARAARLPGRRHGGGLVAGEAPRRAAVPVHHPDLLVAGAVGGEGDRGEAEAAAAGEIADDLVGEGVADAAGHREAPAVALGEDPLAALQVEEPPLEDEAVALGADVAEEQDLVAERAVLLGVARRVAAELQDAELRRALDREVAGDLEVGADGRLELAGRRGGGAGEPRAAAEGGDGEADERPLAGGVEDDGDPVVRLGRGGRRRLLGAERR